jgi:hypothetical protein
VEHQGGAGLVVELAPAEDGGDRAVAGFVEGERGSAEFATGQHAGHHAAVLEFFRRSGLYGKFHPLLLRNTRQ